MPKPVTILKGTVLLTGAGIIVKLLGAAYRIPLARLIGAEGIGLYQMAYPIYLIFLALSNGGIPIAISRIIAVERARGHHAGIRRIFRAAFFLMACLGLLSAGGMILAARWLAQNVVADPRAIYPMWALAPAILMMSLMSAFRGYFQGWQDMGPSAVSQIVEQFVRVAVALILATLFLKLGIEHASAGAAFGATAGGTAGLVYLGIIYWRNRRRRPPPQETEKAPPYAVVIARLIKFAVPISLAVILMPLLQTFDSIIVPNRLQGIGYTMRQATALLGILGNSWAILYLPMIVTTAMASNLVPAMAGLKARLKTNQAREELHAKIGDGFRLALIYLVPVAVLMHLQGGSIYRIVYSSGGIEILSWFAPAALFLGIQGVSAGILQGLGRPHLPLVNFCFGAVCKVAVTYLATGWPGLNLAGAALGTVCGAAVTALLNYAAIKRLVPLTLPAKGAVWLAGAGMYLGCFYLKRALTMPYFWEFVMVCGAGLLGYLGLLALLGGITSRDREVIAKVITRRRHSDGNRAHQKTGRKSGAIG